MSDDIPYRNVKLLDRLLSTVSFDIWDLNRDGVITELKFIQVIGQGSSQQTSTSVGSAVVDEIKG